MGEECIYVVEISMHFSKIVEQNIKKIIYMTSWIVWRNIIAPIELVKINMTLSKVVLPGVWKLASDMMVNIIRSP